MAQEQYIFPITVFLYKPEGYKNMLEPNILFLYIDTYGNLHIIMSLHGRNHYFLFFTFVCACVCVGGGGQMLQICYLHMHDVNLLFHHIHNWIEIWWLWVHRELIVMFEKPVCNDFSFVTQHVNLLEALIRRWVHYGHKGGWTWSKTILSIVFCSSILWYIDNAHFVQRGQKCTKNISCTITQPPVSWTVNTIQDGAVLLCC